MNLFRKIFGRLSCSVDKHDLEMYKAINDMLLQKHQEMVAFIEHSKSAWEKRIDREIKSGIVIDPGGTCLCRRCGHTVSALHDSCINCCAPITWNA